jgi:hypothetical protein
MDGVSTDGATGRPALPLTGGCPCGAAMKSMRILCCCTRAIAPIASRSGSAFAMNMPVATKAFRLVRGEPKAWRGLSPSGAKTVSWFCGGCGGRINGERPSRPESTNVRAGTLDDTSWLTPGAHIYTRSRTEVGAVARCRVLRSFRARFQTLAKAWWASWKTS